MRWRLQPIGRTPSSVLVVRGTYFFVDSIGLPLEIVLDQLLSRGMMPDWIDYIESAVRAGRPLERVLLHVTAAIGDVYGPEFRVAWEERIQNHIVPG